MTRDTIIKLAREAKAVPHAKDAFGTPTAFSASVEDLERFAALVAAAEREACIDLVAFHGGSVEIETAIRARGST